MMATTLVRVEKWKVSAELLKKEREGLGFFHIPSYGAKVTAPSFIAYFLCWAIWCCRNDIL
jgi:hypothetical protein